MMARWQPATRPWLASLPAVSVASAVAGLWISWVEDVMVNQGQRSHGSRALPADGHTADDAVYTMVTQLHLNACVVDEQGKSKR
jgi:hypothetical protein